MIRPYSLDKPLAALIAQLPKSTKPIMDFASFIASPLPIALILISSAGVSLIIQNYDFLRLCLLVMLVSPLAELSKFITRRKRPETLYAKRMRFKTYSFPSGHTYIATLVFGFLALFLMTANSFGAFAAFLLLILIFLVGVSRVYLGAHFPSDVLAGWLLGSSTLFVIHTLEGKLF